MAVEEEEEGASTTVGSAAVLLSTWSSMTQRASEGSGAGVWGLRGAEDRPSSGGVSVMGTAMQGEASNEGGRSAWGVQHNDQCSDPTEIYNPTEMKDQSF